jgi:hypothetical protein
LLTINTLFTNPMLMVVEKKNLSPKMFLTRPYKQNKIWMQRCSSRPYFKAWMLVPTTWRDTNLGCDISPIISYKWTRSKGEFPHSLECIENHIWFTLQGGWKWGNFASFAFKSKPWCVDLFFQGHHAT